MVLEGTGTTGTKKLIFMFAWGQHDDIAHIKKTTGFAAATALNLDRKYDKPYLYYYDATVKDLRKTDTLIVKTSIDKERAEYLLFYKDEKASGTKKFCTTVVTKDSPSNIAELLEDKC